jgi:quercetin dioxygenase-like cupin family protein
MPGPVIFQHIRAVARFHPEHLVSIPLFVSESFVGVLVCLQPGQGTGIHVHEHKDEAFDVVEGCGTIYVDGQAVEAGPGTLVFIPAGVPHGLHNQSRDQWLLRETVHERVYARTALRLVLRAVMKRLLRPLGPPSG